MNQDDEMEDGGLRVAGGPDETPPDAPVAAPVAALAMPDLMDDDLDFEEQAAAKQPEAKPVDEPAQPVKVRETAAERRDRAAMEAQLAALKEENEYWRKNGAAKPAAEAKPASVPEMSTDDMINMFVTDPKALFQKLNLVTADQVERIADQKAEAKARWDAEQAEKRATVYLPAAGEPGSAAVRTPGRWWPPPTT